MTASVGSIVIDVGVATLVIVFVGAALMNAFSKAFARAQGHNRCHYCHSRLRVIEKSPVKTYATTCFRCGRQQPWTAESSIPAILQSSPTAQEHRSTKAGMILMFLFGTFVWWIFPALLLALTLTARAWFLLGAVAALIAILAKPYYNSIRELFKDWHGPSVSS